MVKKLIPGPKTKFLLIKCIKCGTERKVFSASVTEIKCDGCNHTIVYPSASKAVIEAKVIKVLSQE
ncbi:MAG: 30S ribosomal protein S27e [archaeon]